LIPCVKDSLNDKTLEKASTMILTLTYIIRLWS